MRPLPRIVEPPVSAAVVLDPSGAHELQIYLPRLGCELPLTRSEVEQIKEKVARFERECLFEDGRPVERAHRTRVAI